MQARAGGAVAGALGDAGFGAALTGQNLPLSATQSAAAGPLSLGPAGQFTSNVLGALLAAQETTPQSMAGDIISALNPGGTSLSLGRAEQALTGSASSSTSPQALGIASAFSQLDTNGDGQVSQSELATALQSLPSDARQGIFHHHRHHHRLDAATSDATAQASGTTSTADAASTASVDTTTGAATLAASA